MDDSLRIAEECAAAIKQGRHAADVLLAAAKNLDSLQHPEDGAPKGCDQKDCPIAAAHREGIPALPAANPTVQLSPAVGRDVEKEDGRSDRSG
jgi:hypothetical protein